VSGLADQFAADAATAPGGGQPASLAAQFQSDATSTPRRFIQFPSMAPRSQSAVVAGNESPIETAAGLFLHGGTSAVGYLAGLVRAGGVAAAGGNLDDIVDEIQSTHNKLTWEPPAHSPEATALRGMASKYSPFTLLSNATGWLGDKTLELTCSPALATVADVGTNFGVTMGAGKMLAGKPVKAQEMVNPAPKPALSPRVDPTLDSNPSPPIQPPVKPAAAAPVNAPAAAPGYIDPNLKIPESKPSAPANGSVCG